MCYPFPPCAYPLLQLDAAVPTGRLTWWQAFGATTTEVEEVGKLMLREIARATVAPTA